MGKGEGKGEGKGGRRGTPCKCCTPTDCVTTLFIIVMVIGGVLLCTGIGYLGSSANDTRGKRVDEYNDAVALWSDGNSGNDLATWQAANLYARLQLECADTTVETTAATYTLLQGQAPSPEDTVDDNAGDDYTQWIYTADLTTLGGVTVDTRVYNKDSGCSFTVQIAQQSATNNAQYDQIATVGPHRFISDRLLDASELDCGADCTDSSGNCRKKRENSAGRCNQRCSDAYNGIYNTITHTCYTSEYIDEVCTRLTTSSGTGVAYSEDSTSPASGDGCYWDNDAFVETTTTFEMITKLPTLLLRSTGDPHIQYLEITDGGGFGLSTREKLTIGGVLFGIGAISCIPWFLCAYCCCKHCSSRRPAAPPSGCLDRYFYNATGRYGGKPMPADPANPYPPGTVPGAVPMAAGAVQMPPVQQSAAYSAQYQPAAVYPPPAQPAPVAYAPAAGTQPVAYAAAPTGAQPVVYAPVTGAPAAPGQYVPVAGAVSTPMVAQPQGYGAVQYGPAV